YAAAFVLWSVAQGLTGFTTSLGMLITFRVLLGIGEAIYLPGGTRVVSLFFHLRERGLACGLFDFGTRTGLVLEGVVVPYLVATYGWWDSLVVSGVWGLCWLIPWLWVTPRQMRCPPPTQPAEASPVSARELWALLGNRNLIGICLGFFCFDYYWYLLVTWLP